MLLSSPAAAACPCLAGNQAIIQKIRETKPKTVVLYAAWLNYLDDWSAGWPYEKALRDTLRELKAAGIEDVKVLGPAPYWKPNLPISASKYWTLNRSLPDRLFPSDRPHKTADEILKRVAEEEGATFLSVYDALCDKRGCAVHTQASAEELISWDYGHFTWQGAEYVSDMLFGNRRIGNGSLGATLSSF